MLTVNWAKTDKFYIAFIVVLILLSVLLIVTFKSIFSAYISAYEVSPSDISNSAKIDTKSLDEAYDWVVKK